MDQNVFLKAKSFIDRNARPLDLARWRYHFEDGKKEEVLKTLESYQNEDGGFGHALEPDSWNPNSSPIQTWTATEILRETGWTDSAHPVVTGLLRYLESGRDFDGKVWYNTVITNNDYPHAPWWHTEGESSCHNDYNPTACLAGFIIRFSDPDSDLYAKGCRIAKEAVAALSGNGKINDMHTLLCYIRLMEYCEEAGVKDLFDMDLLKENLLESVKSSITQNIKEWENSYICKPSQFLRSRDSMFYQQNREIADYECIYIIKTQQEDGSWNIPWSWNEYPKQWAVSENWWKSNGIIINLLYLKGMEN